MSRRSETVGHLLAVFTILLWGTTFISTKVLLVEFKPVELLFYRYVIAFLALLLAKPKLLHLKEKKQEWLFAGAGLTGVTLYAILEATALQLTYASNVSVIIATAPFFTALAAHFLLKGERLRLGFLLGFVAAIAGIAIVSFNGAAVLRLNPLGDLLAVLAALSWAFYSVFLKKIGALGYSPIHITRRIFFWALVFMTPAMAIFRFEFGLSRLLVPKNILNLLFLGIGASALCYVTWNVAVLRLGAVKTSVYIYLVPVVTVVSSVLLLDEKITWLSALGMVLTLAGLCLSELRPRKKTSLPESGEPAASPPADLR